MDKIYTRKRIRIPYIQYLRFQNGKKGFKQKIVFEFAIILIIAIVTLCKIINSISPIIDRVCEDAASAKATIISNDVATQVMENYTYEDLVNIYKDSKGNITMLQSNIVTINAITSDIAIKIQNELINSDNSVVKLKFRKLYWC